MYDKIRHFCSSNLIEFDRTESLFEHAGGKLVKHDNNVLVVGGWRIAPEEEMNFRIAPLVEELVNNSQLAWAEHLMSPVKGVCNLFGFTALSAEGSLFIFGQLPVFK